LNSDFWRGRRVLVTGCMGFLGSWLTAALVKRTADVVGLVHQIRHPPPPSQLDIDGTTGRLHAVYGDLCDQSLICHTLETHEIDTIFHLAGQTIVGEANKAPLRTFETNIRGTWLLLEAARLTSGIRCVIVASSEKAYGDRDGERDSDRDGDRDGDRAPLPFDEDHALRGRHPYDVSKSCADLIAQCYAHSYGLPVAITRCSNLFGGGDLNWNRLLPGTIRSVLRGEAPVIRSDGTFRRDYLYAADAVRAYLMLAEQIDNPAVCGQPFNFGLGQPASALEVVETIIRISDHTHLHPIILNEVQNEIQDEFLSPLKAQQTLGWRPRYTLTSGLAETMEWYRAYLEIRD
jgi:CDP-glucose 4,6-dehydratase